MNTIIIDTKSDERFFIISVEGKEELFKISKCGANLENLKKYYEEQGIKVVEQ